MARLKASPEGLIPDSVKICWRLHDKMLDFDRASRYKNRIPGTNESEVKQGDGGPIWAMNQGVMDSQASGDITR